jgi:hypothetical protein
VVAHAWVVAHGGTAGAIVEGAVALALISLLVAVWLHERRHGREDELDELSDDRS